MQSKNRDDQGISGDAQRLQDVVAPCGSSRNADEPISQQVLNATEDGACQLFKTWPEGVIEVAPGLLDHACRASFALIATIADCIVALRAANVVAAGALGQVVEVLCSREDHSSQFLKEILQ